MNAISGSPSAGSEASVLVHCADGHAMTAIVLSGARRAAAPTPAGAPAPVAPGRWPAPTPAPRPARADYLLHDYIGGGSNYLEACDLLAARKRLAGVERRAEADALERFIVDGRI